MPTFDGLRLPLPKRGYVFLAQGCAAGATLGKVSHNTIRP